jgi:50S ribosomal subunit-associated GTPase HflX
MDLHHSLIEPFKVTLEHLKYSDMILYVRDWSHP